MQEKVAETHILQLEPVCYSIKEKILQQNLKTNQQFHQQESKQYRQEVFKQFHQESKRHNIGGENPSSDATSGVMLTSSQDTWVKQMNVIFIVQEVDEQVKTLLDPLPANATAEQRTTFREALKKGSKALFFIHQCVDAKLFEKIADFTTSKEAWDTLQKSYGGDAKVKKVKLQALKRQYELLEMKNDETIADYFTRVVTLTNQMKNCGSNLAEQETVEKVLRTLTSKFEHIVVTIEETKDLSEIKIEDLQSTLEAHEMKHGGRNHGKEDEQALFVKFKKYQDDKKKWQKKKESLVQKTLFTSGQNPILHLNPVRGRRTRCSKFMLFTSDIRQM
ncbi:unnamed protein product [Trifolium pratense]|uniref:Uncharacterized protein n=1 Tax=Trifolium pratense TaxID=57577 RepID=A0ACB0J653_TRIPR|nr:unnamed protein product [Trifolium pratense]